jgi:hypothetical protein
MSDKGAGERSGRGRNGDEPLRGLTAAGPSKVGTEKAMRARDVSRSDAAPRERPARQRDGGAGSSGSSPVAS